jgi:hypothetical protein
LKAEIELEYQDVKTAEAISNAISPDNFKAPLGFLINTTCKENTLVTNITGAVKISTFISTIDDLLFCISTAESALKAVSEVSGRVHTESEN